ncbi:MAG: AMP-binding protein [Chthoniobacterales bacterium]
MILLDFVAKAAATFPNAIALRDFSREKKWTYLQLEAETARLAFDLHQRNFQRGDLLATHARNSSEHLLLLLAALRMGVKIFPISFRLPREEAANYVDFLGAKFVDIDSFAPSLCSKRRYSELGSAAFLPATYLLTSGSSATPKIVVHSLQAHLAAAFASQYHLPVKPGSCWLLDLSLSHISGLSIIFRCILHGACMSVCSTQEGALLALRNFSASKITHLSMVSTQLQKAVESGIQLQEAEAILLGGGPILKAPLKTALQQNAPLYLTYGMTETASQIATSTRLILADAEARRCGQALPGRSIRIASDGEILVRSDSLALGYLTLDSKKKQSSPNNLESLLTNDEADNERVGWFCTKDIGELDEKGLRVLGRKDRCFISGGENIQPESLECVLESLPSIRRAVVVPYPDTNFGRLPLAFISTDMPRTLWEKEIVEPLRKKLPKFAIPRKFLEWPTEIDPTLAKQPIQIFIKKASSLIEKS